MKKPEKKAKENVFGVKVHKLHEIMFNNKIGLHIKPSNIMSWQTLILLTTPFSSTRTVLQAQVQKPGKKFKRKFT